MTVRGNELRANNLLTYVADDPSVPVMLELAAGTAATKVVQGNRIGGGMLRISGGDGWQIGGLAAGQGNVLIGVRAVLDVVDSSNDAIQGNYLHHDYHGGFSQGFNLWLEGSSGNELAEHNVIRGGSWPIQSFGGEFRYNLVIDSGHDFWRSASRQHADPSQRVRARQRSQHRLRRRVQVLRRRKRVEHLQQHRSMSPARSAASTRRRSTSDRDRCSSRFETTCSRRSSTWARPSAAPSCPPRMRSRLPG